MGLFGTLGKIASAPFKVSPFGIAGKYGPVGLAKKGAGWAGQKSAGATGVNKALEDRLSYLQGNENPTRSMIPGLQKSYDDARTNSSRLSGDLESTFRNFMGPSGGMDPSRIAGIDSSLAMMGGDASALRGDANSFRTIGRFGAADEAGANRIRGGGVYDEFAKTGGYSDADRSNIRARATSVIPSFFTGLKSEFNRQNAAQGGFNPGYGSQTAKLARDSAREGQAAARDAEFGIMDRVNEGRRWGAQGMTDSESRIVANMLAGLGGAASATSSAAGVEGSRAGLGLNLADSIRQGNMFGASGLENLRTAPGADLAYSAQLLQALGMNENQINQILAMQSGRNPNDTNWDKYGGQIMGGAGAILGV